MALAPEPIPAQLTPAQQEVLDGLLAPAGPRPTWPDNLREVLRGRLEEGIGDVVARAGRESLFVSKHVLGSVHGCETNFVLSLDDGPPGIAGARGTVTHRAIELGFGLRQKKPPASLVDLTLDRLLEEPDRWPGDVLAAADEVDLANLRTAAIEALTKLEDTFPPLRREWRPRIESRLAAELCGGTVRLSGKLDLALFRAEGTEARVLVIDFKSGSRGPGHGDDLGLYALLEALRCGVPPWRVATFYVDEGAWKHEDVDMGTVERALRRVVDGVHKLVELRFDGREPTLAPGPACGWCTARATCPGAARWAEERALAGA